MPRKTAKLKSADALPEVETKAAFAARIQVTPGRVSQLIRDGLPVADGRIPVADALEWIEANVDRPSDAADGDGLVAARIRAANALARSREFDLRVKRGEYMERLEAIAWIRGARVTVEEHLHRLPSSYAALIAERLGVDASACEEALEEAIGVMIGELGDTVPPASLNELLQLAVRHTHGDDYHVVENEDVTDARH